MTLQPYLRSTLTGQEFAFDQVADNSPSGESLEVVLPHIEDAKVRDGEFIFQRWRDFLPFAHADPAVSLGEGNTPLIRAAEPLQKLTGISNLYLKDETQNPTCSFKDRGSLTCIWMAKEMKEPATATISTGNMGNSIAAYAARSGLKAIVYLPHFAPEEKVRAIAMHGATIIRMKTPDYSAMKSAIAAVAGDLKLRVVTGNGPLRVEGYKLISFELFEQMRGEVPDFIAVPTSACGHIRGIWKGFREMQIAGLITKLPRMIIVQAANNSPIVTAIRRGLKQVVPFSGFETVAEAITSGNPLGGDEILSKCYEFDWLAEDVTEAEILDAQQRFAHAGHFVEPATATSLYAVKKLRDCGKIAPHQSVVLMLTGSGLKDMEVIRQHSFNVLDAQMEEIESMTRRAMNELL